MTCWSRSAVQADQGGPGFPRYPPVDDPLPGAPRRLQDRRVPRARSHPDWRCHLVHQVRSARAQRAYEIEPSQKHNNPGDDRSSSGHRRSFLGRGVGSAASRQAVGVGVPSSSISSSFHSGIRSGTFRGPDAEPPVTSPKMPSLSLESPIVRVYPLPRTDIPYSGPHQGPSEQRALLGHRKYSESSLGPAYAPEQDGPVEPSDGDGPLDAQDVHVLRVVALGVRCELFCESAVEDESKPLPLPFLVRGQPERESHRDSRDDEQRPFGKFSRPEQGDTRQDPEQEEENSRHDPDGSVFPRFGNATVKPVRRSSMRRPDPRCKVRFLLVNQECRTDDRTWPHPAGCLRSDGNVVESPGGRGA